MPRRRSIDAGTIARLTQSFSGSTLSIDREIYDRLETVRARSRDLSYNNDYMRKFLALCRTNIVGPNGFALQVRAKFPDGKADKTGNDAVENAFWRWARRGACEVSGKYSFTQLCQLAAMAVARDGEALLRKAYVGPFGFRLQLVDIDRLAIRKNEQLAGGAVIKMGVELSALGEPVAYHLTRRHPSDSFVSSYTNADIERVPAADIYHIGIFERPEQTRCLPWAVSAILRLEHLGAYEEAAVIASRYGAAKMAYWTQGDANGESYADSTDDTGQLFTDFEPGEIRIAPNGAKLEAIDWKYPHEQYDAFVKACVRGISAGIGVAYSSISNDLSEVNYSSIRSGVIDERDGWMTMQGWFIESLLEPVFADWLRMALASGQVRTSSGGLITAEKFDKFNVPEWRGRRWQWVDPKNDIDAAIAAVKEGLRSRREIAAEQGRDLDAVFDDLAAENALAKEKGITLGEAPAKVSNGQEAAGQTAA